ncbi:MAG: hypothetical protein LBV18_05455 [Alistipes sp.]|nr:hypothetical protein [Alistipes sp.]
MDMTKSAAAALLLTVLALGATQARAQQFEEARGNGDGPHAAVHVSFFSPLGTNGLRAPQYTNDFSLNMLVGVSKSERYLTIGGLANIVKSHASGLQIAGLGNYVGDGFLGVQLGGIGNIVGEEVLGLQFGGVFNTAGADMVGLQLSGVFNGAEDVTGFQVGGVANAAESVEGFQIGGVANLAGGVMGIQLGGVFNSAAGGVAGIQISGVGNHAGDVSGLQIGGLFNIARNVSGVQLAGLVNVADRSDYPIGLVNIIKDGEMAAGVNYNDLGTISLQFRSGGRVLYGIVGLGYNHRVSESRDAVSAIAGFGAHIGVTKWFRINNELTFENFGVFGGGNSGTDSDDDDFDATFRTGYSLLPAFRLGRLELFGGPGIYYVHSSEPAMFDIFPKSSLWEKPRADRRQQVYIGWQAGLQFIF